MDLFLTCIWAALGADILLGSGVFAANPRRTVNQHFLTVSAAAAAWMACMAFGLASETNRSVEFWIRQSHAAALFMPVTFNFLRLSINHREYGWWPCVRRSLIWVAAALAGTLLCQTTWFIERVQAAASGHAFREPVFGPLFPVYTFGYLAAIVAIVWLFIRDGLRATGMIRIEQQFILLGISVGSAIGITLTLLLPLILHSSQSVQLSPLSIVAIHAIVAYGIATHRIMAVADVLRRATAYTLLTAYLVMMYLGVWWAADAIFRRLGVGHLPLDHLAAALTVAFSMTPANGWMQRVARRLFVHPGAVDVRDALQRARRILESLTTMDSLLDQFVRAVAHVVGSDAAHILLLHDGVYAERAAVEPADRPMEIPADDPLPAFLLQSNTPAVADAIQRMRPSPAVTGVLARMAGLPCEVAVGIRLKGRLEGMLLLGKRLSGHIYGNPEQEALQLMCDQLAVVLDNARLFTQLQESKTYSDTLVDNLVGAVVAAGRDRTITVFNREAQRITGTLVDRIVGRPLDALPEPLGRLMEDTFSSGITYRDHEVSLATAGNERIPIQLGTSIFYGPSGDAIGVLLVFNDLTTIKKLEEQVRRSDRLASMGTLSAGMAHEIKNPLVTIKTFTELLPERYEDPDFRDSFLALVGSEVKRIDGIVNKLLRFARPSKPSFSEIGLHEVLDSSLRLVDQELKRANIGVTRRFDAVYDTILGDADLLSQAFVNFFLNSKDAMPDGGELAVESALSHAAPLRGADPRPAVGNTRSIHIRIRDSGEGIEESDVPRIFDPFFTTKSQGTGLGLSVSHEIVHEQGGAIDVQSKRGEGTTIELTFPLVQKGGSE